MTGQKILIVDDEPGITSLCERLLKRADFLVDSFNDPTAAKIYLEKKKLDLLLVDIRMPEISGFDLISLARQAQPDVAVLVMTGFGTVETAIQALRQGVDGLILKPFKNSAELLQAVRQALDDNQKKRDIARIQALEPLFDITETLLSETHPERLMELVVNAIRGHLHCENAGYYEYLEEDGGLHLKTGYGITLPESSSTPESPLVGRADALATPFWVNASGPGDADLQASITSLGLSSVLCAPVSRMNVRGVLYAGRDQSLAAFRQVDWDMYLLLVRQAAVAMENARLYEEQREYVRRVEESQQALVRAEKMAAAGRLTASIAHEINNPLQAVQNCLHLATRKELPLKKQHNYLNLANQELERLMVTVQRMLDFYRPGAVEPKREDIAGILKKVITLLSPQLKARGIDVSTGFSSRLPPVLLVSSQVEQVFINLILNAYDAMPQGGHLRISAHPAGELVEVLIQDTGPGISEQVRNHIFEPFVSTKEGGTGIGLTVSYGIIAAHGGSLDLMPDCKPGACFRVTLPIKGES